jgi:hypothetical protein
MCAWLLKFAATYDSFYLSVSPTISSTVYLIVLPTAIDISIIQHDTMLLLVIDCLVVGVPHLLINLQGAHVKLRDRGFV